MKTIVTFLNNLIPNQTVQSVLRHGLTLLGAWLAGRGIANDLVVEWIAGGAIIALLSGVLGAANELYAETGTWKQFWLSIVRHILTAAGSFAVATGKLSEEMVAQLIAVIASLAGIIWGTTDEAKAQGEAAAAQS